MEGVIERVRGRTGQDWSGLTLLSCWLLVAVGDFGVSCWSRSSSLTPLSSWTVLVGGIILPVRWAVRRGGCWGRKKNKQTNKLRTGGSVCSGYFCPSSQTSSHRSDLNLQIREAIKNNTRHKKSNSDSTANGEMISK